MLLALARAAAPDRLALVGGAVRDLLLHRVHADPWRGLPDLDLVVEPAGESPAAPAGTPSPALRLAQRLAAAHDLPLVLQAIREHGAFGTVELELEFGGSRLLLDVATARRETYGMPGDNPRVCFGSLRDDLARRDFSINAIALVLDPGTPPAEALAASGLAPDIPTPTEADIDAIPILDPHGGLADLRRRNLRLLHGQSLRDDPTRILRAARYAARLDFALDPASLAQWRRTLAAWPWPWRPGDPPALAPPALGTRLRMELELLLDREPRDLALDRKSTRLNSSHSSVSRMPSSA